MLIDLIRKSAIHPVDFFRLAQIIVASGERAFHLEQYGVYWLVHVCRAREAHVLELEVAQDAARRVVSSQYA